MRAGAALSLFHAFTLSLLAGCNTVMERSVDFPDVDVPAPAPEQIEAWRKNEPWRNDPCRVAHEESQLRMEVPWRGQSYRPEAWTFHEANPEHPEWGTYVVRGFNDHSGRTFRYRIKLGRSGDVWYVKQLSHYVITRMPHPVFGSDGHAH